MLTVRMIKYKRTAEGEGTEEVEQEFIRESRSTLVCYKPDDVRVLELGWDVKVDDMARETTTYRIGALPDCQFDAAYVINEDGHTICKL